MGVVVDAWLERSEPRVRLLDEETGEVLYQWGAEWVQHWLDNGEFSPGELLERTPHEDGLLALLQRQAEEALRDLEAVFEAEAGAGARRRKKLWEIDSGQHCAIIGTCLTLEDLHKLVRQAGLPVEPRVSEYDLHRSVVLLARTHNPIAKRIHKLLDRKFEREIRRFAQAETTQELTALWQEAVGKGSLIGAYWALVTHPSATPPLLDRVYGEVHMLSHLQGASNRAELRRAHLLQERTETLETELAELRARLVEKEEVIQALNRRLAQALEQERRLQEAQQRLQTLAGDAERAALRTQLTELGRDLEREQRRADAAEQRLAQDRHALAELETWNRQLQEELGTLRTECASLEESLRALLSRACQEEECPHQEEARCTASNLCGRRILYVGGRTGLHAHYRALVEQRNGEFLHHDGGLEDGRRRLPQVLASADAVLCPVDCVSHDACLRLRTLCKRSGKPLVLLRSSGLSSFVRGLQEIA